MPHQADRKAPTWTIDAPRVQLLDLAADVTALDARLPRQISFFNTALAVLWADDIKRLELDHFSLRTESPTLQISDFRFQLEQNPDSLTLKNFIFKTAQNTLSAEAALDTTGKRNGTLTLQSAPLHLDEIEFMLPDIHIKGNPILALHSHIRNDELKATINIENGKSSVDLSVNVAPLSVALSDSAVDSVNYSARGTFKNIILSEWGVQTKKRIRVNGDYSLKGRGLTPETAEASATVRLNNSAMDNYQLKTARVDANYHRGRVKATVTLDSDMGQLQGEAHIHNLYGPQNYQIDLACRHLNLQPLLSDSLWVSDLNFDIEATGQHFSPQKMQAEFDLHAQTSSLSGMAIDSTDALIVLDQGSARIDSLTIHSPALRLNACGFLHPKEENQLDIQLRVDDLKQWHRFIPADSLDGSVTLFSQINGSLDSLQIKSNIVLEALHYNGIAVDSIALSLNGERQNKELRAEAQAHITTFDVGAVVIREIELAADMTPERIDVKSRLRQSEELTAETHVQYFLYDLPVLFIKQLDLNVAERKWHGGSDSTSLMLGQDEYIVTNFLINSQSDDSTSAYVFLDGAVRLKGNEDFRVKLRNFNLGALTNFIKQPIQVDGIADIDLNLGGTAAQPRLSINTHFKDLFYDSLSIKSAQGLFTYENELFKTQLTLVPVLDTLALDASIPITLSLADQHFDLLPDRPFELSIKSKDIPLTSLVPPQLGIENVAGFLNLDFQVSNTLADPIPRGSLNIRKAAFQNKDLGINFDDLSAIVKIQNDSLLLQQLIGRNGKGTVEARGSATLNGYKFPDAIENIKMTLKADDFYVSEKSEHQIQINSDIKLAGPLDSLVFDGRVNILRASFYLPSLNTSKQSVKVHQQPLLVQALNDMMADSLVADSTIVINRQQQVRPILQNLRGKLTLNIQNNTWIKSDNMRLELSADLDITKNTENFEVFGPVQILRGQYDFLGRRFNLSESSALFQGGETINPKLDAKAVYVFRDMQRNKHTITLNVTGDAASPTIQFMLDENSITEGEAISYILFNRSPDEINQQAGDSGSKSSFTANDLMYGLMSAELSKRFGRQLGVDYIEFKGKSSTNTATLLVGKYVTPDLFMSYEQSIGALEEDQAPQVITVEYELTKYIFLQLISGDTKTTGADVMIKFAHN